jgi:hypothetical protein
LDFGMKINHLATLAGMDTTRSVMQQAGKKCTRHRNQILPVLLIIYSFNY